MSKINFIIKEPTKEELRRTSLSWLNRIQPTLIDRWPEDMHKLSVPTTFIPFPLEAIDPLYDRTQDWPPPIIEELAEQIDRELGWKRKFFRLNSRSPKDFLWPFEALITLSGKEVLSTFAASERILSDLACFQYVAEQPALICLRDQIYITDAREEFRGFVKDSELIAVTYYRYDLSVKSPKDGGKTIRERINKWFTEKLKPTLHIDTVVFDLHVPSHGPITLIEINPYGLSDPCQFVTYENVENASTYIQFERLDTGLGVGR